MNEKQTALDELAKKNEELEKEKDSAESGQAEFKKDNDNKEKTLKEKEAEIEKLSNELAETKEKVEKEASDKEIFKQSAEEYIELLEKIRDEVYDFFGTETFEVNNEISEDTIWTLDDEKVSTFKNIQNSQEKIKEQLWEIDYRIKGQLGQDGKIIGKYDGIDDYFKIINHNLRLLIEKKVKAKEKLQETWEKNEKLKKEIENLENELNQLKEKEPCEVVEHQNLQKKLDWIIDKYWEEWNKGKSLNEQMLSDRESIREQAREVDYWLQKVKHELLTSQNKLTQEQADHQQTRNDLEKAQAENKNLQELVEEYENEEEFSDALENQINPENNQPSVLNNLFQKGKGLVSQAWNSLPVLPKKSTLLKGGGVLATHAVAYQTGLRYGTFNQLEFVSQDILKNDLDYNFNLQKELDNAYQSGNRTVSELTQTIGDFEVEQFHHERTREHLNQAYTTGNFTQNERDEAREALDQTHQTHLDNLANLQEQADTDIWHVAQAYQGELEELKNILKIKQEQTRNQKIYDWARELGEGISKGILMAGLFLVKEELKDEKNARKQAEQKLNDLQNQSSIDICSRTGDQTFPTTEDRTENQTFPATTDDGDGHSQTNEETGKTTKENNEQQIAQQINQELNLGLDNPTLNQVINEIKELIHKPPTSSFMASPSNQVIEKQLQKAQQTITQLEKELSEKSTPFGESLETIKQLEINSLEELFKQAVDSAVIQQIQQATSYQQVVAARQAFLQKNLEQKENITPVMAAKNELVVQPNKERAVLISLLASSLIGMGGLLMKLKGVKISNKILWKNS